MQVQPKTLVISIAFVALICIGFKFLPPVDHHPSPSMRIPPMNHIVNHTLNKPHKKSGYGYIMATHYSDQLRAGMINIFSIQCWAASLKDNLRVVLPFLRDGSHHGINLSLLANTSSIKKDSPTLFDLTDEDTWMKYANSQKFAPFVSWDYFLNDAPKKLILVDIFCTKIRRSFHNAATKFAVQHGFKIIRSVCDSAERALSAKEFRTLIYGEDSPHNVTVIFYIFGGVEKVPTTITRAYRIGISDLQSCSRGSNFQLIPVSQRIKDNTEKYIQKYLPTKRGYIAVMVRFEKLFIRFQLRNVTARLEKGRECIERISDKISALRARYDAIYLTMDTSKYGTESHRRGWLGGASNQLAKKLFDGLFENESLTYDQWEGSFEDVADYKEPGYIATLQLNIAANADMLLLAGGGSFQEYAIYMLHQTHSKAKDFSIKNC